MDDETLREQREDELLRRLLRIAGGHTDIPDTVALRVKDKVHAHWQQQLKMKARKRILWIFTGSIAACFLFLVIAWLWVIPAEIPPQPVAIVQDIVGSAKIHHAETVKSNLPLRGTVVFADSILQTEPEARMMVRVFGEVLLWIDGSTRLQFQSESDFVLLEGAVELDTGKTHRRITVSTSMGKITNNGTRFQVRLKDSRIEIRVREGSVSLKQNQGIAHPITAGNQLIADSKGKITINTFDFFKPDSDWMAAGSSTFDLEGRTLMEFLRWVCSQNGWTLKVADPEIEKSQGNILLHGSVATLSPEEMLAAVLPVCGMNYSLRNGILTVGSERG